MARPAIPVIADCRGAIGDRATRRSPPRRRKGLRLGFDRLGRHAGLVEGAADAETGGASFPIGRELFGRDAAHGKERRVLRQDGSPRLDHFGRHGLGGEELEARRAEAQRGERLGRRRHSRQNAQAQLQRAFDHRGIGVRRDDQAGAGVRRRLDRAGQEHGPGADERGLADPVCDDLDALERIGRVERNLDRAEAGLDKDGGDGFRLIGLHAAENGDQGRRRKSEHHASPA